MNASLLSRAYSQTLPETPQPGELIFTEIMADPTPNLGVFPEVEYLELHNPAQKPVALLGVRLRAGSRVIELPSATVLPGEYVLICPATAVAGFQGLSNIIGLPSFPALANSGAELSLSNAQGVLLERLVYSDAWYRDSRKRDGGWSLERIDAHRPGACPSNWQAARDPRGGTPGAPGSALPEDADRTGPLLLQALPESAQEVRLFFNEPLQSSLAADPAQYAIRPSIPIGLAQAEDESATVLLILDQALQPGTVYSITVSQNLPDCLGNPAGRAQQIQTGLAEPPLPGDLIINEVLFDPQTGGSDFVELFNASKKLIRLQGLRLRNAQKTSGNIETIISTPWLLFPENFAALTPDTADLRRRYPLPDSARLIASPLPTLDAGAGNVTLLDGITVLDATDYAASYHNPLLREKKGVSLERISPQAPSNDPSSWHSAASSSGFATPGYRNSQFFPVSQSLQKEFFVLENATFSPDGDGFQDFLLLRYQTDNPDYLATIRIFDAQGRLIRTLASKVLLASDGFFQWDGANAEGLKSPVGMYVVWIEYLRPGGAVSLQKLTCVLAAKLR